MRKLTTVLIAAVFTVIAATTAFAGTWKQDAKGWWWDNGNGTWPANTWQWCDGNGDGTAECYYFDGNGYCLMNTTTPDGYTVNKDGAWTVNGAVQTQGAAAAQNTSATQTAAVANNSGVDRLMYLKKYYGFPGETKAQKTEKMYQVFAMGRSYSDMEQKPLTYAAVTEFLNNTDWPNMSDYEKAKAVYERVSCGFNGNTYGAGGFSDGDGWGYEWQILAYKHGVCGDYARAYVQLAELVGLETHVLELYYSWIPDNHAMGAVKIDGQWYAVDPTDAHLYKGSSIEGTKRTLDDPFITENLRYDEDLSWAN